MSLFSNRKHPLTHSHTHPLTHSHEELLDLDCRRSLCALSVFRKQHCRGPGRALEDALDFWQRATEQHFACREREVVEVVMGGLVCVQKRDTRRNTHRETRIHTHIHIPLPLIPSTTIPALHFLEASACSMASPGPRAKARTMTIPRDATSVSTIPMAPSLNTTLTYL